MGEPTISLRIGETLVDYAIRVTRDRDRLSALLLECLPLVIWHKTSGFSGRTLAPDSDLDERIKAAALEG